jgi:DNA-directed RNA polymerase specialized sigma24 family protein
MPATTDVTYTDKVARATLILMIEQRSEEQQSQLRNELLLARAGFSAPEIAEILDKQASAVRMALSRARKA